MLWVDRERGPNSKIAHYYRKRGNKIAKQHTIIIGEDLKIAKQHATIIGKELKNSKIAKQHAIIIGEELKKNSKIARYYVRKE